MKRHFLSRPMSIPDLCEHMGMKRDVNTSRRMIYLLRRREARTGKQILIGGGKGRRIQVTLASLRNSFPELVDTADYFANIIEQNTEELRDDMLTQVQVDRALGARVRANAQAIERITKELETLRSGFPV